MMGVTDQTRAGIVPARLPADVAIIVPTFNEVANVPVLVEKLEVALMGHAWEVIFVDDDSPDGTAEAVNRIGRLKPHVRCIQRIARRGLSSAVIEGVLSVNSPWSANDRSTGTMLPNSSGATTE